MEWAERLFLSIVLSIAVLVVVSLPLVYGPWRLADGRGLFQGSASGAPVLEALLLGATLLFAGLARLRARRTVPFAGEPPGDAEAHRRAEALARGECSEEEARRELYGP